MACYLVSRCDFPPFRRVFETAFFGSWTSGAEVTTWRRICRTRYVTSENYTLTFFFMFWIMNWNSGKQSLGVRMQRCAVKSFTVGQFNYPTQIHNRDPVCNMTDHAQIV